MAAARRVLTLIVAAVVAPACVCTELTAVGSLPGEEGTGQDAGGGMGSDAAGDGDRTDAPPDSRCAPLADCQGECVDVTSDPHNCGRCDERCEPDDLCVGGACVCADGLTDCGDCVDVTRDREHCGGCDVRCGGDQTCSGGTCTCTGALAACSGECVDLTHDDAHCGACDTACPQGTRCDHSSCRCPSGTLCGTECVDTRSDPSHCGGCFQACSQGQECHDGGCRD